MTTTSIFVAAGGLAMLAAVALKARLSTEMRSVWRTGIVLFSGSLYALALSSERWLGAVMPTGGTPFF